MNEFIAKYESQIGGVISGFDRLVFRGNLRSLVHEQGMKNQPVESRDHSFNLALPHQRSWATGSGGIPHRLMRDFLVAVIRLATGILFSLWLRYAAIFSPTAFSSWSRSSLTL